MTCAQWRLALAELFRFGWLDELRGQRFSDLHPIGSVSRTAAASCRLSTWTLIGSFGLPSSGSGVVDARLA